MAYLAIIRAYFLAMPTTSATDPEGYYSILGVSPHATSEEIKQAFRKRAMEMHPDRNTDPCATQQFQALNAAYAILSDPTTRAKYDTDAIQPDTQPESAYTSPPAEPIVCSCCNKVTAQPRYVIFYEVKAFLFFATRTAQQGVMCSACAEKKAIKASAVTWALGWWSLHGFIWSLHAIATNLFGGEQSRLVNARLTAHQAWILATRGNTELARAVAFDALHLARGVRPDKLGMKLQKIIGKKVEHEGTKLCDQIEKLIEILGNTSGERTRLNNSWRLLRFPFYAQSVLGLFAILLAYTVVQHTGTSQPAPGPKPYASNNTPPDANRPAQPPRLWEDVPERYQRPPTSPSGELWPRDDSYMVTYPLERTNGRSTVTLDNTQNTSDVFVKLVSLDGPTAYPVRTFFIHAKHSFTVADIDPGLYDVRYQDLTSGSLSRTESFTLEEVPTEGGTRYSTVTFTLYKVAHGNAQIYPLSAAEF